MIDREKLWRRYRRFMETTPAFRSHPQNYAKIPLLDGIVRNYEVPHVLEIGVQEGWGMLPLAAAAQDKGGTYTGVDLRITDEVRALVKEFDLQRVTLLEMPSEKFWRDGVENPFDVIVLDGGHDYLTIRMDILNALRCLARDGWLLVHDVLTFAGPQKAFAEICGTTRYGIFSCIVPLGIDGMGVAFVTDQDKLIELGVKPICNSQ